MIRSHSQILTDNEERENNLFVLQFFNMLPDRKFEMVKVALSEDMNKLIPVAKRYYDDEADRYIFKEKRYLNYMIDKLDVPVID